MGLTKGWSDLCYANGNHSSIWMDGQVYSKFKFYSERGLIEDFRS